METKTLTLAQVVERMRERGIKQATLADMVGMGRGNLANMLHGRTTLGPDRRRRLAKAVVALGLDIEDDPRAIRTTDGKLLRLTQL